MLFSLLINVEMPTSVGILTFMSRKYLMLSQVEHDYFLVTSDQDGHQTTQLKNRHRQQEEAILKAIFTYFLFSSNKFYTYAVIYHKWARYTLILDNTTKFRINKSNFELLSRNF